MKRFRSISFSEPTKMIVSMITRLVKMSFKEDQIQNFKTIFCEIREKIMNFQGCIHLDLLQDKTKENVFFTYSQWQDESALENYRNSAFFRKTWAKTKLLFDDQPQAWTTVIISSGSD